MNASASELIATKLREIRQINDDAQQQNGDRYKQSVARMMTEIVAALEMVATSGYQSPLGQDAKSDKFRLDKSALSGSDRLGPDEAPEPKGGSF